MDTSLVLPLRVFDAGTRSVPLMRACSMLRASHQVLVGEHRNTFSLSGRAKTKERRKRHNSSVSTADREPVRRVGATCAR